MLLTTLLVSSSSPPASGTSKEGENGDQRILWGVSSRGPVCWLPTVRYWKGDQPSLITAVPAKREDVPNALGELGTVFHLPGSLYEPHAFQGRLRCTLPNPIRQRLVVLHLLPPPRRSRCPLRHGTHSGTRCTHLVQDSQKPMFLTIPIPRLC